MKIIVKVLKSKHEHTFTVEPTDTPAAIISELKTLENQETAIVRLIHNQRILRADKTFESQFVADNAELQAAFEAPRTVVTDGAFLPQIANVPPTNAYSEEQGYQLPEPGFPSMPGFGMDMDSIKDVMNNPFLRQLMQSPDFLRQMMENPMMEQLKERNPMLGEMLEDPDTMRQMQEIMTDPVKMDEMLRQQDAMMSTITNNPEALRMYQKLRYDMEEIQQNSMENPEKFQDFAANAEEALKNASSDRESGLRFENQQPFSPASPQEYFPSSYTDHLTSWYGERPGGFNSSETAAQSPNLMGNMGADALDGMARSMNIPRSQLESMLNDPEINSMIDMILNDPQQFSQLLDNPALKQELNTMMPGIADEVSSPEAMRELLLFAREAQKAKGLNTEIPANPFEAPSFRASDVQTPEQVEENINELRLKYATQLEFIRSLGCDFSDNNILEALEFCNGDCERAMNYLLDNE